MTHMQTKLEIVQIFFNGNVGYSFRMGEQWIKKRYPTGYTLTFSSEEKGVIFKNKNDLRRIWGVYFEIKNKFNVYN